MITHRTFTIDEAFQLTLKIEKHSKQPLTRRIDSKAPTLQPSYKCNNVVESKSKATVITPIMLLSQRVKLLWLMNVEKRARTIALSVGKRGIWHGNVQRGTYM